MHEQSHRRAQLYRLRKEAVGNGHTTYTLWSMSQSVSYGLYKTSHEQDTQRKVVLLQLHLEEAAEESRCT